MSRTAKAGCLLALVVGVCFAGISSTGAQIDAQGADAFRRKALERINGIGALGAVSASAYRNSVTVSVKTRSAINAATSKAWIEGVTGIAFGIDIDRNSTVDRIAWFENDGAGSLVGEVTRNNSTYSHLCNAVAQQYATNGYRVVFHRYCLWPKNLLSIRMNVIMLFDEKATGRPTFDDAPNGVYTPHIFPG